ncbi:FAD/NAD(P)-binding domain-containing protein [Polyporus arcularius HHB13444]|uniref:FAD/NAD(P)-binding domain-containing protein n=1 Tax=Polyporus arcularius HHB13444 TaxID=1314778 RepID=A0A5C3NSG5_9APHY|nr:FAD/NAD(P)-binding domain-containing protein [Polyporus arcularius HHB13444]
MPIISRSAELSLDFLVVGGGIGGLSVAYMLQKAGHRVRVVEKQGLHAPSAGLRIPPNLSKILWQWVDREELDKVTTRCVGTPMHSLHTGKNVGYLPWKPAVMAEIGGEFLLMHRQDLIRLLFNLATEVGVIVDLDTTVTSVRPGTAHDPRPTVTLDNGGVLAADIVIGSDGCNSIIRPVVVGEEQHASASSLTVYTGTVNAHNIVQDAELAPLIAHSCEDWPIWMGDRHSFSVAYQRSSQELYIGLYVWHRPDEPSSTGEESWDHSVATEVIATAGYPPIVQRLIKMAPHFIRTEFTPRNSGQCDWVDTTGQIVLLGDAAHPSIPGGQNIASMAIEDAVVFGSLFSHLRTMEQVPSFLGAYQELRQPRCEKVGRSDIKGAELMALPPGPAADARDENIRQQLQEWDEGMLKESFEEIAEIFGYDAGDAAEEWWINWGRFHETAGEQPGVVVSIRRD